MQSVFSRIECKSKINDVQPQHAWNKKLTEMLALLA